MFASDASYKNGDPIQQAYIQSLPPLRSLGLQAPTAFVNEGIPTESYSHSTTHPYSDARYNLPENHHIRGAYAPQHLAVYGQRPEQHIMSQPMHLQFYDHQEHERRTNDLPNLLNNLDPALTAEAFSSQPAETPTSETSEPSSLRKGSQREKVRVDILDDSGARSRAFVACRACRARKIKCDGGKPECNNCTKRAKADEPCAYDAAPRRRGPDKQKGGRQRMTKEAKQRMLQGTDTSGASTS